jgi:hypothetical protein
VQGEHLVIPADTLVFYVDDSGDESLGNAAHPIFAFGGVACVTKFHAAIDTEWRTMKATTFPQVKGPLHAKTHLRERLPEIKRLSVLAAAGHSALARFGAIVTSSSRVPRDKMMMTACGCLANRFAAIAEGMIARGYWNPPGRILAIFEHSARLAPHLEAHFTDLAVHVGEEKIPVEGCFLPKSVANPFLEMADFVVSTVGRNVKFQLANGRESCTPNFDTLFRRFGPPLADYIEVEELVASMNAAA